MAEDQKAQVLIDRLNAHIDERTELIQALRERRLELAAEVTSIDEALAELFPEGAAGKLTLKLPEAQTFRAPTDALRAVFEAQPGPWSEDELASKLKQRWSEAPASGQLFTRALRQSLRYLSSNRKEIVRHEEGGVFYYTKK